MEMEKEKNKKKKKKKALFKNESTIIKKLKKIMQLNKQ